jgi:hypothetical protein
MNVKPESSRSFWLTLVAVTFLVNLTMTRLSYLRLLELGADLLRTPWSGILFLCFAILLACIWLFVHVLRFNTAPFQLSQKLSRIKTDTFAWRVLGLVGFCAILFLIPYTKFTLQVGVELKNPVHDPVLIGRLYYWGCWWALLLAMTALKVTFRTTWQGGFAAALILLGVAFEILTRFNAVTNYPLSMGWSEGSRYYYASLYFSQRLYGDQLPLSTLHPTRYLLQSLPFLIPSLDLTVHRAWQFLLWIGLTAGSGIALAKRIFPGEKTVQWLFAGWFFLFLLRVGVYYHLEVMVILPLLFVSTKHPWRTLSVILIASIWAGLSRVNWFPVPAMIAIAIYILETPVQPNAGDSSKTSIAQISRYLALPALWAGTGLIAALGAQAAYVTLSGNGNNADAFLSSLNSDLLWYRLWPNDNHALGILPAILVVSGPLVITLILAARQWHALHPIRWLGLFSMIISLFAGSLIVSVKIGGGGDLHNMDAYAVLIGIIAGYFFAGQARIEAGGPPVRIQSWWVFVTALLIPILFLIPLLSPYPKYDEDENLQAYQQLTGTVQELGKNGPVLFINERQLVTFGDVHVPFEPDYEAVTLMEMAMSNNQAYLDAFYNDLANQRFSAIVATKQNTIIKQAGPLVEENNVWNSRVSPYILCYYQPLLLVRPAGNNIEVYVPAVDTSNCP